MKVFYFKNEKCRAKLAEDSLDNLLEFLKYELENELDFLEEKNIKYEFGCMDMTKEEFENLSDFDGC